MPSTILASQNNSGGICPHPQRAATPTQSRHSVPCMYIIEATQLLSQCAIHLHGRDHSHIHDKSKHASILKLLNILVVQDFAPGSPRKGYKALQRLYPELKYMPQLHLYRMTVAVSQSVMATILLLEFPFAFTPVGKVKTPRHHLIRSSPGGERQFS